MMKIVNKAKILLGILILIVFLYGIHLIIGVTCRWPLLQIVRFPPLPQLAQASNLYNEPYILPTYEPEIIVTSPSPDTRYNIKDELSVRFLISDTSFITEADIDGKEVEDGQIIKASELAIGKHTLTVKIPSVNGAILADGVGISKEVIFIVHPLVSVKGLISDTEEFTKFYIEGLGVDTIYDKTIELVYRDKLNDTEHGLNSEDGSSSIWDYDGDTIPELQVSFNKAWLKDILDTNPYAEFTLRLELNDGTVLNVSSTDWESQDPSQLLVVGLKDGVAAISAIDVTRNATGEVSIKLKDELGDVITSEPLGVASNMSSKIWVSFSDKKIRMYNSCGELQMVDGVNWYWQVSKVPDGLDYDGISLRYCSSETNKLYQISSSGAETDLGIIKRRLSLDGVATDNTSVNYATQEYEGYNPTAISGTYLSSAGLGKISKRAINIGANFIQTLPAGAPIWTNEQDTPGSCLGITQIADSSVPEGHVVYISCIDGNVYKIRFEDVKAEQASVQNILGVKKEFNFGDSSTAYFTEEHPPGAYEVVHVGGGGFRPDKSHQARRLYRQVTPPDTFITANVIYRGHFIYSGLQVISLDPFQVVSTGGSGTIAPTNISIITTWNIQCTSGQEVEPRVPPGCWYLSDFYNNPTVGTTL